MTSRGCFLYAGKRFMIVVACQCWAAASLMADPLVKEWNNVQIPAMPELKRVTADSSVTALFMISMTRETCNPVQRPRCAATVPGIAELLTRARDHHVLVIHSLTRGGSSADHLVNELAPHDGEPIIPAGAGPDKFIGSNLDEILKQRGIKTVIVVGTQAQTAVLHTGAGSAFRGYRVIVPIDGMSSDTAFPELYTAWHLATTSRIGELVTLTTSDMIGFSGLRP